MDLEPLASIVGAAEEEGMAGSAGTPLGAGAGRRRERKHRYLDSLMDKAGEMNLRCESRSALNGFAGTSRQRVMLLRG